MSDVFEKINILRANAHKTGLPTIQEGRLTLSHELIGVITKDNLKQICINEHIPFDAVNGFDFYDRIMEKILQLVIQGYSVQTDWLHSMISLSGTVPPERLGHNALPDEVSIKVNFNLGKKARNMLNTLQVFIHNHISSGDPVIQGIWNPTANVENELDTGEMALIKGLNVRVQGDQLDKIGVFFIPVGGGAAVHIPAGKFSPNMPTSVQFIVPAEVSAGEWMLTLATQMTAHKEVFTKDVRESSYPLPVLVK